jgi:hypothetical protein
MNLRSMDLGHKKTKEMEITVNIKELNADTLVIDDQRSQRTLYS